MDDVAASIGAVGALGIDAFNLSQGVPVSSTLIGGVSSITSGAATTQTTLFLLIGLGVLIVAAIYLLK